MQYRPDQPRKTCLKAPWTTLALAAALILPACETDVPASDETPPEIQLVMNGGGIGSQSMSNPPTEVWAATDGSQLFDLTSRAEYTFTLTVTDDGGVARAAFRLPADFEVRNLSPDVRVLPSGLLQTLQITGDRASPRNALVISGQFSPPETNSRSVDFSVEADDFGGASGAVNQRFMRVEASLNSGLP